MTPATSGGTKMGTVIPMPRVGRARAWTTTATMATAMTLRPYRRFLNSR